LKLLRLALIAVPTSRGLQHFYLAAGRGLRRALHVAVYVSLGAAFVISSPASAYPQATTTSESETATPNNRGSSDSLREQVPGRYRARYDRWKATLLSVEFGRRLWSRYAADPTFRLTIVVSKSKGQGGEAKDYRWDEGRLVAATIVLGNELDYGSPEPTCYPVLGSFPLVRTAWDDEADDVLAAAKIAHEFGHVEQMAYSDAATFQLQNALIEVYASRFLSNGYNDADPPLMKLAERMGGTPIKIRMEREHFAETYALRYLLDKLKINKRRELLRRVRENLEPESSAVLSLRQ